MPKLIKIEKLQTYLERQADRQHSRLEALLVQIVAHDQRAQDATAHGCNWDTTSTTTTWRMPHNWRCKDWFTRRQNERVPPTAIHRAVVA